MEKKCSKCGKLFNLEDKPIKMVDTDGNPLRIDLCSMCELDNIAEEVMESKHISRKEAEEYIFNKINEMIDEVIGRVEPYNNGELIKYNNYWNVWNRQFTTERFDKLVKVVKDNEICSD